MPTILVAENEPGMRYFLAQILGGSGYQIAEAASTAEALELVRSAGIDLLLADISLSGSLDLADTVRREHPAVRLLFVSAQAWPEFALLRKPFTATDMLMEVARLLAKAAGP